MAEQARKQMTSDEFIAWAMEQPETCHYELVEGEVVAMAPERSGHTLTKFHVARQMACPANSTPTGCRSRWMSRRSMNPTRWSRGENGIILTRIVRVGPIIMDPPGITLTDCFPPGVD